MENKKIDKDLGYAHTALKKILKDKYKPQEDKEISEIEVTCDKVVIRIK